MDSNSRLAEYSTLREEALRCIDAQRDLVKLNITASGAVAALAIADAAKPGLLVILAFLSPILGLLWLDQDAKIHRIALYVRSKLWTWRPSWEMWLLTDKPQELLTRVLAFDIPTVVVFLSPAVAGLIVSGHHREQIGGVGVWIVAFAPLALYVGVGLAYLWRGRHHKAHHAAVCEPDSH